MERKHGLGLARRAMEKKKVYRNEKDDENSLASSGERKKESEARRPKLVGAEERASWSTSMERERRSKERSILREASVYRN